jgi:uncharacterized membrane protein
VHEKRPHGKLLEERYACGEIDRQEYQEEMNDRDRLENRGLRVL